MKKLFSSTKDEACICISAHGHSYRPTVQASKGRGKMPGRVFLCSLGSFWNRMCSHWCSFVQCRYIGRCDATHAIRHSDVSRKSTKRRVLQQKSLVLVMNTVVIIIILLLLLLLGVLVHPNIRGASGQFVAMCPPGYMPTGSGCVTTGETIGSS